jgi:uncharacterized protein YraI
MHRRLVFFCALILISISFGVAAAQGVSTLTPGGGLVGTLSAQSPLAFFTFNGTQGDLAEVRAIGLTPNLSLSLTLLSPTQQNIGSGSSSTLGTGDASVSLSLPQTGTYTVLVGGDPGDFVITLDVTTPPPVVALDKNAPAAANLSPETAVQTYSFDANPFLASSVTLDATDGNTGFAANFYDPDGSLTTTISGLSNVCLGIPAGEGTYQLVIELQDAQTTFAVSVILQDGACGSASAPPAPQPSATPVESLSLVCSATPGQGTVNVRSGPGTNFDVVAQLQPGQSLPVVGQSGTGWYAVQVANVAEAWAAASVLVLSGRCDDIPTVGAGQVLPPAQTQEVEQPAGTPTFTYTPSQTLEPGQPTATYTATQPVQPTATHTYTPSYTPTTPPPPPTAPPDANYNFTIQLDSTASVTDFVSYPNGDTEDRVFYDIGGMNPNSSLPGGRARLILAVSCFGTGTQNVTFFTQGQTYSCGQTIFDQEVTFNSKTGSVLITAVAGENTYVQWVLTGTATRVN